MKRTNLRSVVALGRLFFLGMRLVQAPGVRANFVLPPDGPLDHVSIRTRVEIDPYAQSLVTSASHRSNDGQIHSVSRLESAHSLLKFVNIADPDIVHGQH